MCAVSLPKPETTGEDYFDVFLTLAALAEGEAVTFPPLEVVRAVNEGVAVTFALNMARDPIQNAHRLGQFYEEKELRILKRNLKPGCRVLDVGANVGNHALFFALHVGAARVVVVEPNPLAQAPLVANVVLNGLTEVIDMSALGVGLGRTSEDGFWMKRHDKNLGATKMKRGGGPLAVHAGDDLFEGDEFDLIKIDVEGMEMQVLAGLEQTIARCRPLLLVEVDEDHDDAFSIWAAQNGYQTLKTVQHSPQNCNYLMVPSSQQNPDDALGELA